MGDADDEVAEGWKRRKRKTIVRWVEEVCCIVRDLLNVADVYLIKDLISSDA